MAGSETHAFGRRRLEDFELDRGFLNINHGMKYQGE